MPGNAAIANHIGPGPSAELFVRRKQPRVKTGRGKELEFQADRQIAKIMIAITQRARHVRRAPMSHPMFNGFGSAANEQIRNGPGLHV